MRSTDEDSASGKRGHVPVPALIALALILALGPVAYAARPHRARPEWHGGPTLAEIARSAGCRLTEFQDGMDTNPPVTGRFLERARVADGSYAGRRPPSLSDTIHAMFHGRVLFQYRPGLAAQDVQALDRLTRRDTDRVLLFENQTGMAAPVAATAYLSVMTCPRVDRRVLAAFDAFRERRRAFGQSF
jgi:uncharacterized protein DUF3105